jgi:outer membrane murein-binding lipoprotein Lpp
MPHRTPLAVTTLASVTLASVILGLTLAACGDPAPVTNPNDARIAELTRAVEDLAAANESLAKEVRQQGRRLADLSGGRASRVGTMPEGSPALAPADATSPESPAISAGALAEDSPIGAETVDAVLRSDSGQKAIQEAASREIERREQKDRRLFVSYEVGRFARSAGLDDTQTEQLQAIWKTSMDGGVELRKQFAAIGKLPEAERQAARGAAMQTMRDLGAKRRESVRELLNEEQWALYEPAEEKIVAGLHGAPRR